MAKETLREENKRLIQELEDARLQIDLLRKEVSKINNDTNAAYENSSFYEADQACIRDLKQQVEMLKRQLSHSRKEREKASEEIRLLTIEKNVAVERMADAQNSRNGSYKKTGSYKILSKELEAVHRECRELKLENKKLKEDKELLEQRVSDLEHSLEEADKNTDKLGKTMEESSDYYIKQIKQLQAENEKLRKNQTGEPVHNARNAGRKKNDATYMKRYAEFADLVRNGKGMAEVMEQMKISRSTYFRFLKLYREDKVLDEREDSIMKEI